MTIKRYTIETSLTTDYRSSRWGIERIVLDAISNHLPADSKGTKTTVKLKQDGKYVDLRDAKPDVKTEEVVFEDDGQGYDSRLLSVLFSTKGADELSVGQFGEGLKMVAAAALRNNVDIEYSSKNWIAKPVSKKEVIGKNRLERLCFDVEENGFNVEGSRTVFSNPSAELINEIFQLPEKVLPLNDNFKVLYKEFINLGYISKIVDLGKRNKSKENKKSIFVKGVKVSEEDAIFDYDLGIESISPDRMFAEHNKVLDTVYNLLANCINQDVIQEILLRNFNDKGSFYLEVNAFNKKLTEKQKEHKRQYNSGYPHKELKVMFPNSIFDKYSKTTPTEHPWVSAFKKLFGKDAVLASFNEGTNEDAKIMGYNPIKLSSGITDYLHGLGIQKALDIKMEQEYKWISKDDLTNEERAVLRNKLSLDEIVFKNEVPVEVKIYSGLYTKTGREIETSCGVHITEPNGRKYIGIKRGRLKNPFEFAETYLHETVHHLTGAEDNTREFSDYFIKALAKLALGGKK